MAQTTPETVLRERLSAVYAPIGDDLLSAEEVLRQELASKVDFVEELTARVQLYRGKRIRPALLLLVARACGRVLPAHYCLAAVVEMIHVATLVHDDVLDEAELRRHARTVNAEWGRSASVLLGDFLFTHAFHLAASLETTLACRMIGNATNRVCEGELHQIARRGVFTLTEDEYLEIVTGKTAELLACSCSLGAHYAGASGEVVSAMDAFGRNLGIAFQIADDLLDLVGNEVATGKATGNDLQQQKMTLPLIRFRQSGSAADVTRCEEAFHRGSARQRDEVLRLLRASDALVYTQSRARYFAGLAAQQLEVLDPSPARDALATMARYTVERPH